jgi:hypothetical protein
MHFVSYHIYHKRPPFSSFKTQKFLSKEKKSGSGHTFTSTAKTEEKEVQQQGCHAAPAAVQVGAPPANHGHSCSGVS